MKKLLLSGLVLAAFATTAFAADCVNSGKVLFCSYPTGCFKQQNTYGDDGNPCSGQKGCESCATKISNCTSSSGVLYTGVREAALNQANEYGQGVVCADEGGSVCDGCTGTESGDSDELCGGGCSWDGGPCYPISTDKTGKDQPDGVPVMTCTEAIGKCTQYGSPCSLGSPIITKFLGQATGNALIAMSNAVNLQITEMATFSIYDMKGKMVRSQKIWQSGSHAVSLQELPRGLYVVQATSGSWKQTVKVTVK